MLATSACACATSRPGQHNLWPGISRELRRHRHVVTAALGARRSGRRVRGHHGPGLCISRQVAVFTPAVLRASCSAAAGAVGTRIDAPSRVKLSSDKTCCMLLRALGFANLTDSRLGHNTCWSRLQWLTHGRSRAQPGVGLSCRRPALAAAAPRTAARHRLGAGQPPPRGAACGRLGRPSRPQRSTQPTAADSADRAVLHATGTVL